MIDILKSEMATDELNRGYESMTAAEVAADMNTKYRTKLTEISSAALLAWAAGGSSDEGECTKSRNIRISEAAASHVSNVIRGIAKSADMMLGRGDTTLDLSLEDRQTMVGALVAGGVLTAEESAELYALASQSISRAEELGLNIVKPGHIEEARRNV